MARLRLAQRFRGMVEEGVAKLGEDLKEKKVNLTRLVRGEEAMLYIATPPDWRCDSSRILPSG